MTFLTARFVDLLQQGVFSAVSLPIEIENSTSFTEI